MDWVKELLTPLIKVIFIGGFFGTISFFVIKAFYNAWSKSWKFVWKYTIRKQKAQTILDWCLEAYEKKITWHEAKKLLMVKGINKNYMNETLWIYDRVIKELSESEGGVKNGRKFERSSSKNEEQTRELPKV